MNHRRAARWAVAVVALVALALGACQAPQPDAPESADSEAADSDEPDDAPDDLDDAPDAPERPEDPDEPELDAPDPDAPDPDEPELDAPELDEAATPEAYGVSAAHPQAVDVGMDVLADGGSAADAAIAAAYAVSVVEPFASGIGGGGVTLVHEQWEDPQAYDYREIVPDNGIPPTDVGVPGFVAGMEELHGAHGSQNLETLIEPAIGLAEDGVPASGLVAEQLGSAADRLPSGELEHLFPQGVALEPGAPLVQEELASTLRSLADGGAATFYEGELADELAARVDGLDTTSLGGYEVGRHEPTVGEFADYEIVGAPPPLPGATVVQMLQVTEALGVADQERDSADFVHTVAMSWRLARQFLETDLGDPSFVDAPTEELTDPDRNAQLAAQIPDDEMLPIDTDQPYGGVDPNTTHVTVVDADGTVVSMTNTLTNFWGSGRYELGFFLNNQMARFDIGREGSNEPEPGRRSVTWSSPLIVADDDGPVMGLGTPGGERIPIMLVQVLASWAAHEAELDAAVAAPRFHSEGTELVLEEPVPSEVADDLLERGYTELRDQPTALYFGSMQALAIDRDGDELIGATDERRDGDWRVEQL